MSVIERGGAVAQCQTGIEKQEIRKTFYDIKNDILQELDVL